MVVYGASGSGKTYLVSQAVHAVKVSIHRTRFTRLKEKDKL